MPPPSVIRWRKRLQDALLDTHFAFGGKRVVLALEPDQILSIANTIHEAGATIATIISPTKSPALTLVPCDNIIIGDFDDVENSLEDVDLIISNYHAERLAQKYHKKLLIRGFPNYEILGNQLKYDVLYEGSCYLLFELANLLNEHHSS